MASSRVRTHTQVRTVPLPPPPSGAIPSILSEERQQSAECEHRPLPRARWRAAAAKVHAQPLPCAPLYEHRPLLRARWRAAAAKAHVHKPLPCAPLHFCGRTALAKALSPEGEGRSTMQGDSWLGGDQPSVGSKTVAAPGSDAHRRPLTRSNTTLHKLSAPPQGRRHSHHLICTSTAASPATMSRMAAEHHPPTTARALAVKSSPYHDPSLPGTAANLHKAVSYI